STVMAAVAVGATLPTPARWYGVLARAWLETATAAGVIALALVARAGPLPPSPWDPSAGALLTATAPPLAGGYQAPSLTWIGSTLALGTITYTLAQTWHLAFPTPLLDIALLGHATLALFAGLAVPRLAQPAERLDRVVGQPLGLAALVSSALALPLLLATRPPLAVP